MKKEYIEDLTLEEIFNNQAGAVIEQCRKQISDLRIMAIKYGADVAKLKSFKELL